MSLALVDSTVVRAHQHAANARKKRRRRPGQYGAANTQDYSPRFSAADGQAVSIDTNGQNVNFGSALTSNNGSLTKLGGGILTLDAANTYTGATTILGGTLAVGANGSLSNGGNVTVASGGTLSVFGSVALASTSTLTLDGGSTNPATALLSGDAASLSVAATEYVGNGAYGVVTQTGGTHTAGGPLYLGYNAGSNGVYNLSSTGALSANLEAIGFGNTTTFNQTGGTNTVANQLRACHALGLR